MIASTEHGNFDHVSVLLEHLRLQWLLHHFSPRLVWTAYVCVNCFITIGVLGLLVFVTGSPFVFPSLGPTCVSLLLLSVGGSREPSQYRSGPCYWAHLRLCCLALTMTATPPFGAHTAVHGQTVLAAALSLSATGAFMVLFRVSHPPAGATTLIVSLGIISQPLASNVQGWSSFRAKAPF